LGAGDVMVEAVAYVPRLVSLDSQLSERCDENGRIGFRCPVLSRYCDGSEGGADSQTAQFLSLNVRRPVGNQPEQDPSLLGIVKELLDIVERPVGVAAEAVSFEGELGDRLVLGAAACQGSTLSFQAERGSLHASQPGRFLDRWPILRPRSLVSFEKLVGVQERVADRQETPTASSRQSSRCASSRRSGRSCPTDRGARSGTFLGFPEPDWRVQRRRCRPAETEASSAGV
jgi:hypothetical protein